MTFKANEWKIVTEFVHQGVIYSRGSAVPETLSAADRKRFEGEGRIARKIPRAGDPPPVSVHQHLTYTKPDDFLRGTDVRVLRTIREIKPDRELVTAILESAEKQMRSDVLVESLRLFLGLEVTLNERRRPRSKSA